MNSQDAVKSLVKLYKQYHFSLIGVLLILASALAVGFQNRTVSMIIGGLGLLLFLGVTLPAKRAFRRDTVISNLLLTTGRRIGAKGVEDKRVTVLTPGQILEAALVPVDSDLAKPYLAWGMKGEEGKYRVALSDVSLAQRIPGAARTKSANFTTGVWTHMDLPFDSGRDYRLMDPAILPSEILEPFLAGAGLTKRSLAAEEGRRTFIFACPEGADHAPGAGVLARIEDLAASTPGIAACSLRGRSLDVFLVNRFLAPEVSVRVLPAASQLEHDPFPELGRILKLASAIRLDQ